MSAVKIKIESLYKIFGKNPKEAIEHVKKLEIIASDLKDNKLLVLSLIHI